jgi:hypothetical protein
MEEKKKVIILAEEHPSNMKILASLGLGLAKEKIEESSKNLIKTLNKRYVSRIERTVEIMENSIELYLKQQDIKLREYKILDSLLSSLPTSSTKLYVEGSRGVLEERLEIDSLVKKYGIEVVLLDEGNPRYEKLEDENSNPLKSSSEIQIGREDYWVNKINTTIKDCKYAIAIVGRNHLRFSDEFIYRTSRNTSKEVGYFGEKLKQNNYDVEIIDVVSLLPMDSKA